MIDDLSGIQNDRRFMICVNLFREWVCSAAVVLVNRAQI